MTDSIFSAIRRLQPADSVSSAPINVLTVDLEEWFCASAFDGVISRDAWPQLESRVERPTRQLLEIFDRHSVKATFFVLGWVAERHPALIAAVAERGHEIASHGHGHCLISRQSPAEFHDDVAGSLRVLRQITGRPCHGYRAPSFSLRRDMVWAWRILAELGIRYDSSIFPVVHDRYGDPGAPRFLHRIRSDRGEIVEFPLSTLTARGRNLPVGGGGYLRLYPLRVSRWAIRRINREGHPAVVYVHPWELDPQQPRPRAPWSTLLRHRVGIDSVRRKLDALLSEFRFGPMQPAIEAAGFGVSAPSAGAAPGDQPDSTER